MICIDMENEQLWRDDVVFPLRRKTWQVLRYLISRPPGLVSKSDILDAVWAGTAVEEKVVAISIREIRQALGDDAHNPRFVETVHGRGFRLLVDLQEYVRGAAGGASSRLIGRGEELAHLLGAVSAAGAGRGRTIAVCGEAGIGKSSLIRELARRGGDRAMVLVGHCLGAGTTPPFWPWAEIVEGYLERCTPQALQSVVAPVAADLGQLAPSVHEKCGTAASPVPSQESGRARLFASVVRFLRDASAMQPLVIAIEDIHGGDASTLSLLGLAARSLAGSAVCFVLSYRNDDPAAQMREIVGGLDRDTAFETLPLRGLGDEDIKRLVASLGAPGLPPAIVSSLARRTAGNPFFIEQIVKHWKDLGLVGVEDGRLRSHLVGMDLPLPPAVLDAVHRRLERLSPTARELLTRAAVGGEVEMSILARSGLDPPQILDGLDEAVEARLLRELPGVPARYEFSHALVAEVLHATASRGHRHHLHRDAAEALAGAAASPSDRRLGQIARHYFEAAKAPDSIAAGAAVDFAYRAGRQAASVFAFEQAAAHFDMALQAHDLSRSEDEVDRCRLLLAHADALLLSHHIAESKERFQVAAALARRLRLGKELAIGVLGQTVWNLRPQPSHAADIGAIEDTLALLGEDEPALRARLLARLATALTWHGDVSPRRLEVTDAAITLARQTGDPHAQALVLADRLWTLWDPDHLADRLRTEAECVDLAQAAGTRVIELYARGWQLLDLLRSGDLSAADAHVKSHAPLVEEIGQGGFRWALALFRGTRAMVAGDLEAAETRVQEAMEIGRTVESMSAMTAYGLQLMDLRRAQGRLKELKPMIEMLVAADSMVPLRWLMPVIHAELQDEAAARAAFEDVAADEFRDLPVRDERLGGFGYAALLGDVCGFLGDERRAPMLYDLLRPYAAQWIVISVFVACFGSVSRVLGTLAATVKRWPAAEAHFEDALRAHAAAPPLLARTQVDYAEALLARGGRQRSGKARSLLKRAAASASDLGMVQLQRRIESL